MLILISRKFFHDPPENEGKVVFLRRSQSPSLCIARSRHGGYFGWTSFRTRRLRDVEGSNLDGHELTDQVRSITDVTKGVAGGDPTKKIEVDVREERF